jgi:hypothetical protein
LKYLVPLLNFAVAASPYISFDGFKADIGVVGSVLFGIAGIITAAWAYAKADMPYVSVIHGKL